MGESVSLGFNPQDKGAEAYYEVGVSLRDEKSQDGGFHYVKIERERTAMSDGEKERGP